MFRLFRNDQEATGSRGDNSNSSLRRLLGFLVFTSSVFNRANAQSNYYSDNNCLPSDTLGFPLSLQCTTTSWGNEHQANDYHYASPISSLQMAINYGPDISSTWISHDLMHECVRENQGCTFDFGINRIEPNSVCFSPQYITTLAFGKSIFNFEKGPFDGSQCVVRYNPTSDLVHSAMFNCAIKILEENCNSKNHDAEILTGISLTIAGFLACAAFAYGRYRRNRHYEAAYRRLNNNDLEAGNQRGEDSDSDLPPSFDSQGHSNGWSKLAKLLNRLASDESVGDDAKKLITEFKSTYMNFRCPVGLNLMEKPAKLPCNHVFDHDNIVVWSQRTCSCPLCRVSYNPDNDIKVDEDTIKAMAADLAKLSLKAYELISVKAGKDEQPANQASLRRHSSIFDSNANNQNSDELSPSVNLRASR